MLAAYQAQLNLNLEERVPIIALLQGLKGYKSKASSPAPSFVRFPQRFSGVVISDCRRQFICINSVHQLILLILKLLGNLNSFIFIMLQ